MNFLEALNTKAAEVEAPLNLPVGTYIWGVIKPHKESTTSKGDYNIITIPVAPKGVYAETDDVDPDQLAEYGDLRQGINNIRFMFPTDPDADNERKRSLNQLKSFLVDTLRVEADDDATIKELLGKMIGHEFIGQASHRADAERNAVFVDVKNWMPMD